MQLFLPHHYAAFNDPKPLRNDAATIAEREEVRDAFLRLDGTLRPFIANSGWDLHPHRQKIHYVSSHQFIYLPDGRPIVDSISAMWLHYGKSRDQLDFVLKLGGYDYTRKNDDEYYNAFYLHSRIQFFINAEVFRAWLLLATDNNYFDRSEYLRRLDKNQADRNALFQLLMPLFDKDFFYEIDGRRLDLKSGLTIDKAMKFIRSDKNGVYAGIVKEYKPEHEDLSEASIGPAMIENLRLLFPIYDFMAWRPGRPR